MIRQTDPSVLSLRLMQFPLANAHLLLSTDTSCQAVQVGDPRDQRRAGVGVH